MIDLINNAQLFFCVVVWDVHVIL